MKRITITALAMALGVALLQPSFAFAQEKPHEKGKAIAGKRGQANVKPAAVAPARSRGFRSAVAPSTARGPQASRPGVLAGHSRAVPSKTAAPQNRQIARSTVRNSRAPTLAGRGRSGTGTFDPRLFNRGNAYGGRWVRGDAHRDWDRNRIYSWNNHRYRWYDGGWLMIDGGFWPPDYYEPYPYRYSYSHSGYTAGPTVAAVQQKLAELGYYYDYVDGIIGPNTRHAIAEYQRDYGLPVTGRINGVLLSSLGV